MQIGLTLFLSHVNYCNIAWSNSTDYYIARLNRLQKKAIRIIYDLPYLASTRSTYKEHHILNIFELNNYNIAVFMFLCHKRLVPINILLNFSYNSSFHDYNTRQSSHFHTPQVKTNVSKLSIFYKGPIVWNALPQNIKESPSLNVFRRRYKGFIFSD